MVSPRRSGAHFPAYKSRSMVLLEKLSLLSSHELCEQERRWTMPEHHQRMNQTWLYVSTRDEATGIQRTQRELRNHSVAIRRDVVIASPFDEITEQDTFTATTPEPEAFLAK